MAQGNEPTRQDGRIDDRLSDGDTSLDSDIRPSNTVSDRRENPDSYIKSTTQDGDCGPKLGDKDTNHSGQAYAENLSTAIDPAPHEVSGNLIFTEHGLHPFYALDSIIKSNDGTVRATFEHGEERYRVELYYQDSGLAPRDDPDFRLETVREFRLRVHASDETGERKVTFHIAPRWPGMQTKEGKEVPTPDIEGVNARMDGANIPIEEYPNLLQRAAESVGVHSKYFEREHIHAYSNVFQFELYLRLNRDRSGAVFGLNSPMQRIFEHVEGTGYRQLTEDNGKADGYFHRAKFGSDGAQLLFAEPGHGYAKSIKHYHPEHPRSDPSDPLYHPKVGVCVYV